MQRRRSHFEIVRQSDIAFLLQKPARARILSITHDPSLARTRELLFSNSGFDVSSFLDTAAAIEKCRREAFDLVIVGHSIPLSERKTLVKALREAGAASILALTRLGDAPLPEADYWFDPSESPALLLETVRRILRQTGETE